MKKLFKILSMFVAFGSLLFAAQAQGKPTSKILLIPLDDRPPCLQMPVRMGLIGDAEVVTPPRALLGRFTEFGKSDEIIKWLKTQNLKTFDAAIVSLDMLAYGGLVAMREYETSTETALKRAAVLREMRRLAPRLPIYGSSVIMRLAPTGNVTNEAYRANLARWAEISVDETKRAETAELEKKIPADALENYKKARERDLKLNLFAVDLVRDRTLDYLILSQDDAKPNGVHIADREKLLEYIKAKTLGERVAVQPGADEVSMLLLARALTDKYKYRPRIKAIYSDEKLADQFMPYEDRPLRKTVSFHIKAVGATEVTDKSQADILFYVFVSRFENGRAAEFAEEIESNYFLKDSDDSSTPNPDSKRTIVADVDPKGEIQGADLSFVKEMKRQGLFSLINGYASWNTAGNTIGTALPHGLIHSLAQTKLTNWRVPRLTKAEAQRLNLIVPRIAYAQNWFILNRLLDDYVYHSVVRPQAIQFAKEKGWNVFRFDEIQTKQVEEFAGAKVGRLIRENFERLPVFGPGALVCENVKSFKFSLPWGRTFEAEIDFELNCKETKNYSEGDQRVRISRKL